MDASYNITPFTDFDYYDLAEKIVGEKCVEQDINGLHIEVDADLETNYKCSQFDYDSSPEYTLTMFEFFVRKVEVLDEDGNEIPYTFNERTLRNAVLELCR